MVAASRSEPALLRCSVLALSRTATPTVQHRLITASMPSRGKASKPFVMGTSARLLVHLVHFRSVQGIRPWQSGVFPSIDGALTGFRPILCQIAFKSLDHRTHVLQPRLSQEVGCSRAAIARTADQNDRTVRAKSLRAQPPANFGNEIRVRFKLERALHLIPC